MKNEEAQLAEIRKVIRSHPRKNEIDTWARMLRSMLEEGETAHLALALVGAEEAAKP